MSNRFLLKDSQNQNLSTESTQIQIRDQLVDGTVNVNATIDDVIITDYNMPSQTTNVKVDVLNTINTNSNITNTVDVIIKEVQMPTQTSTINVNVENPVINTQSSTLASEFTLADLEAKIPNIGTNVSAQSLSVVQALDDSFKTDLEAIKGVSIATGVGVSSTGTQRVVLADNQPNVNINLNQINAISTSVGVGDSNTGTQRVVIASDQPTVYISNYKHNKTHMASNVASTNANIQFIVSPGNDGLDITRDMTIFNDDSAGAVFDVEMVSSTNLDTAGSGNGAGNILIEYYSSELITSLTSVVVMLNGTTRVAVASDFYRFKSATVIGAGNIPKKNQGDIYIFKSTALGASIPTNEIINLIPAFHNIQTFSLFYIPRDPTHDYIHFDYYNVGVSTDSTADDLIRIEMKYSKLTDDLLPLILNDNHFYQSDANFLAGIDISNLVFPTTLGYGIDLILHYTHPNATEASLNFNLGYHYSNSPH
jgi:hypothetical protein